MRWIVVSPGALLSLSLACGPETVAEAPVERACPITEPIRLVAAPASFEPEEDAWYGVYAFGDDVLFTMQRFDDPGREYWHYNRCTGDLRPYPPLAPGLHNPYVIEGDAGRIVVANDDDGRSFVVDRLDDPAWDDPRPVLGLPEGARPALGGSRGAYATFFHHWSHDDGNPLRHLSGAAGIGASTYGLYTHGGDPEVPALKVSDTLLAAYAFGEGRTLVHEEGGEVHLVDALTGARELVLTGVRHLAYGFDERTLIWQAIGDDIAEPIYLHTLESGSDIQIAINDFTALSWGRELGHQDAGEWRYTSDRAIAAMIGPEGRFVAAVRIATGESLAIPPHVDFGFSVEGEFILRVADAPDQVLALWDPGSGRVREWYRGPPERKASLYGVDGERIDYFIEDEDAEIAGTGALWRVDLTTGEREVLLESIAWATLLGDARYLVGVDQTRIDGPPLGEGIHRAYYQRDLWLREVGGASTLIAEKVTQMAPIVDEGTLYFDAHGPEPGLWAYPAK